MTYNRWSTMHIEPRHRAEFWRDASQKARTPITPHIGSLGDFKATLTMRGLGDLALNHVQVQTPHDVESTPSDLARLEQPFLFVDLYLSGTVAVSQLGRCMQGDPGQPFLIDGRREYRLNHSQSVSVLVLAVPFAALNRHEGAIAPLIARHQARSLPLQLLANQMHTLGAWPHEFESVESERLSDLLVGTLRAALLGVATDESSTVRQEQSFLRRRVQQIIKQMYADATLNPVFVSERLGISVRTLHARLARDGTSFGAELMVHRLERAYGLLRGARRKDVAINEISARCGFISAAHFSRRFRDRFGVAPSAVMRDA